MEARDHLVSKDNLRCTNHWKHSDRSDEIDKPCMECIFGTTDWWVLASKSVSITAL